MIRESGYLTKILVKGSSVIDLLSIENTVRIAGDFMASRYYAYIVDDIHALGSYF